MEIRRHIYELMLGLEYNDHQNLMCVNKQIFGEAKESFFRRPLRSQSQDDLISFVEKWPEAILDNITNLQLRLEELEPDVMQPFLANVIAGTSPPAQQHPYLMDINRITGALARLPSITQLSLLRPSELRKNMPASIVTTSLLSWAAEHYAKLQSLRLDIEACRIDCLGSFRQLQTLQLIGFSETSSVRTADVLSKLTSLNKIHIVGPPPGLLMEQKHGFQKRIVQSITHQLFEQIRPLRHLTLNQVIDPKTEGSVFLTSQTAKALYEIHRESLQSLRISCNRTPKPAFLEFLSAFLMAAENLQELSLVWPNMAVPFVDCLPSSIRRLALATAGSAEAHGLLDRLALMRCRLRHLRHIKLFTTAAVDEVMSGSLGSSIPVQNPAG